MLKAAHMQRVLSPSISGEADAIPRPWAGPGLGSRAIVYKCSRVAASAAPARDESRDARPGRTHPAGGEAPECLATPPQHAGKEREPREPRGRRRQAGAAQPGCGLQPTSPGQKRSQLRASASPGTQLMAPPPPAGRAPGANPMRLGGVYRSLPGSAGAQPEGQLPAAASVPVLLAVGSSIRLLTVSEEPSAQGAQEKSNKSSDASYPQGVGYTGSWKKRLDGDVLEDHAFL
nr:basic salivary proline-rich protein 2-like [Vicugna pacos]